jgi:hypothetical protein
MTAQGTITIIRLDPAICVHDNGTNICDRGHKLQTPGICVSQSIGTFNSTDDAFQPDFPICVSDYENSSGSIYNQFHLPISIQQSSNLLSFGGVLDSFNEILISDIISKDEWIIVKSLTKSPFDCSISVWSDSVLGGYNEISTPDEIFGEAQIITPDSGWVIRDEDVTSEFFQLDIFGQFSQLASHYLFPKLETDINIHKSPIVTGAFNEVLSNIKSNVTNPGLDDEELPLVNPTEICVGDSVPPFLDNIFPPSGTVLRPENENISFNIKDSIGGVDLSSIEIIISGSQTTQTGGPLVVTGGVEQVPEASLTGSISDYSFLYNPPSDWSSNETVTVTVSGNDLLPTVSGNDFTCTDGSRNAFLVEYSYKIRNFSDMSVSITAIADDSPPYLQDISPIPFMGSSSAFDNIIFHIKDDLSGVDLNSLSIYINSVAVVFEGEVLDSNAIIAGDKKNYLFTYNNSSGFSFGNRVFVRVVANDLYTISPNYLDYTYYYDVIEDSSLIIDNFYPPIGITDDPDQVDISVDIYDSIYDTNDNNLYLSINGTAVSSTLSPIYGNRELTTTISGLTSISGTTLQDSYLSSVTITGTSITGDLIVGGGILLGSGYQGTISDFPPPFDLTSSASLISGIFFEGNVVSGTVDSVLIPGTNWDGNSTNSTISGVEVSSFYATDTTSSGTVISGTIGETLSYHPPNDFNYGSPINVLVHGENLSSLAPTTKEKVYQLLHGYNVKVFDKNFIHGQRVNVFGATKNNVSFTNELNFGYYFTTIQQQSSDCSASITGIAGYEDISAQISPQAPVHRYGETITIELTVSDKEGNTLGPYTFSYTIEQAPT